MGQSATSGAVSPVGQRDVFVAQPPQDSRNGESCPGRTDVKTPLEGLDGMGPFQHQPPPLELTSIGCCLKITP